MNKWIRQTHRWFSVAFVLAVLVTSFALAQKNPAQWVNYLPLPPLAFLAFTGIYLFAQPYLQKWRRKS